MLGDGLQAGLRQEGYAVDWVTSGARTKHALQVESFDLILLDLGLPDCDGLNLIRELRGQGAHAPILILTARDGLDDRVQGLDMGADDYLVKPFDLGELGARVRALLRRSHGRAAPELRNGGLVVDPAAHTVLEDGRTVELSPREFALLGILLENAGKVISRVKLEQSVYDWNDDIGSNALEVHIHHLRKKLPGSSIRTIRGVGYLLEQA